MTLLKSFRSLLNDIVYTEHMEWIPIGNQATKVCFYSKNKYNKEDFCFKFSSK